MNISVLLSRKQCIEAELKSLEKELKNLPIGKIICCHQGKWDKWYYSTTEGKKYLTKKERPLAEKLALKKYLQMQNEDLTTELGVINSYLEYYQERIPKTQSLLSDSSYYRLLQGYLKPESSELEEWSKMEYEKNDSFIENLVHKSISGNVLRSKSEVLIDMMLFQNRIPYHYEEKMVLGGKDMYPDFTIRHPKRGEFFYWEHFGMMDNVVYVRNYLKKMQAYLENGIVPTVNLICTYETQDHPLTLETVKNQIELYFG